MVVSELELDEDPGGAEAPPLRYTQEGRDSSPGRIP